MLLDSLILQTKLFFQEDMDMEITDVKRDEDNLSSIKLKDYSSMIGTGGTLNIMILISYENKILDKLVELYMDGEEVDPDEAEEIRDSVSGETINTIIGLALPTFPGRGKGVTITPPITINDAAHIKKYKDSKIVTANVFTKYGQLSLSAVGPADIIK